MKNDELTKSAGKSSFLQNVREHAPLSAGASVERGVEVENTGEHENRAADRGCCVSSCSLIEFREYMSACEALSDQEESTFPVPFLNLLFFQPQSLDKQD